MMTVTTDIRITKTKEEPGAKSLRVEVPVERVERAQQAAARQYAKRVKLPGFRPGKAPLAVVRKQFRDAIRQSVIQELVGEGWKAAQEQEDLKPIADPRVRDLKFEDGSPVTFELTVEVKPELDLQRLGGFKLTRKVRPVADAMVDQQVEELRKQRAPWVPVEGEKPKSGDLVSLEIQTKGEPGTEDGAYGEARPYQLVIGEGQAIPDLEEQVMTLEPGATVETAVRFPDDFPDETKRGQTRGVRIALHEVKRQDLPAADDAFARELGDFDSMADLRQAIRDDLEAEATREADADVRRQLIDAIVSANDITAPPPLVQRVLSAFAQAYEVPDERLEQFAAEFGPVAERQVGRDLVIDYVAERENLRATEEDVDRRIEEIAERRKTEPGKVYASLQKGGRLKELERNLTEEKVFSHLLEQSTIKDE